MPKLLPVAVDPFQESQPETWRCEPANLTLHRGNVFDVLSRLPSNYIQCCVTSPPYWGLRAYATGDDKYLEIGTEPSPDCGTHGRAQCKRCFVCSMVAVFREVKRVLRDDGVLWLNLGDTYGGGGAGGNNSQKQNSNLGSRHANPAHKSTPLPPGNLIGIPWRVALAMQHDGWILRSDVPWVKRSAMPESVTNRPCKALEYVFMFVKKMGYYFDMGAVRKDGKDWSSGGPGVGITPTNHYSPSNGGNRGLISIAQRYKDGEQSAGRNFRNADLWFESVEAPHGLCSNGDDLIGLDVTNEGGGFKGKHFATYPMSLIRPLIKCSTSHRACGKCGAPWQICIEKERRATRPGDDTKVGSNDGSHNSTVVGNRDPLRHITDTKTVGWQPSCGCFGQFVKQAVTVRGRVDDSATSDKNQIRIDDGYHSDKTTLGAYRNAESHEEELEKTVEVYQSQIPLEQHPVVKCLVLDPFSGSGTTMLVSHEQGVGCVGVELSKEYFDMTVERLERYLLYPKYRAVQIGPPEYDPFSDA